VAGGVAAVEVDLHGVAREGRDALDAAQHAVAQRVAVPVALVGALEQPLRGAVLVHGDLLQDDLLLHLEVVLAQARLEQLGEELEQAAALVGGHGAVVHRALLAGVGVVVGAQLVEDAVDVVGAVALVALEAHVLQEVRHARHVGGLVARAGAHHVAHRGGHGARVVLADDGEAVGQHGVVEAQAAGHRSSWAGGSGAAGAPAPASSGAGPSVTTVGSGTGLAARQAFPCSRVAPSAWPRISSSVRARPSRKASEARRAAVAPLDSPRITTEARIPVRARSSSSADTPAARRSSSARNTVSVSAARSGVVPA